MFELVKRLIKHSTAYAFGTVLNRAVSIVLLPLYTRFLTKSEYGVLEILLITSTLILFFLQFGIGSALFRSVIYKKNIDRKLVVSTSFYFLIISSIFIVSLLIMFSEQISLLLFGDIQKSTLLKILFLGDFFLVLSTIPTALLRIDERSVLFAVIAGLNFIIGIVLNLVFLVGLKLGIEGIILANTITAGLFSLIYFWIIRKEFKLSFSLTELKDMLGFGLPIVPATIGNMILNMSDRYFLKFFYDFETVAIYAVALRISMVLSLAVSAFQMAWPAVLFSIAKRPDAPQVYSKLFDYFLFGIITLGLFIAIFAKDLITIITSSSWIEGARVMPLIITAYIFYGIYFFSSIGLQIEKKTYYFPIIVGIAAFVNITISFYFVPEFGIMGAGYAKLIAYTLIGIFVFGISLRYYWIPYNKKHILMIAIFSGVFYYLSNLTMDSTDVLSILQRMILFILYLFVLVLFRYFGKVQLTTVKNRVLKIRS